MRRIREEMARCPSGRKASSHPSGGSVKSRFITPPEHLSMSGRWKGGATHPIGGAEKTGGTVIQPQSEGNLLLVGLVGLGIVDERLDLVLE